MSHFLQYWKKEQVDKHKALETKLIHSGSDNHKWVEVGDSVWIVTLRNNGKMFLLGRIVVGEKINHSDAVSRYGTNVFKAKYHTVSKLGTEEDIREVNIMDIAGDLRFISRKSPSLIIVHNYVDGREIQSLRRLQPNSVDLLESKWYETDLKDLTEIEYRISKGGGFGNPERNKKVEKAAIDFVTQDYKGKGWDVESVEAKKCGYDLLCKKGGAEEHIEVKGISGTKVSFIITANEVKKATSDAEFVVCAVTLALSGKPIINRFTGKEFIRQFNLDIIAYRAELK